MKLETYRCRCRCHRMFGCLDNNCLFLFILFCRAAADSMRCAIQSTTDTIHYPTYRDKNIYISATSKVFVFMQFFVPTLNTCTLAQLKMKINKYYGKMLLLLSSIVQVHVRCPCMFTCVELLNQCFVSCFVRICLLNRCKEALVFAQQKLVITFVHRQTKL